MKMKIARQTTPMFLIFKSRFESCRWKDHAEVGPSCREGLRSVAATCDQTCFGAKIMSAEITAPLFVSPCDVPLTVHLAAKILSGRLVLTRKKLQVFVQVTKLTAMNRSKARGFAVSWVWRGSCGMSGSCHSGTGGRNSMTVMRRSDVWRPSDDITHRTGACGVE